LIRTERCIIRPPSPEDYVRVVGWRNTPETGAAGYGFVSLPTTAERMAKLPQILPGYTLFAVDDLEEGRLIGFATLHIIDRCRGWGFMGIVIGDPADRGRGYGSEVRRALLEYVFVHLNLRRVYGGFLETNQGSRGLHRRVGTIVTGRLRRAGFISGRHVDILPHVVRREEYLAGDAGLRQAPRPPQPTTTEDARIPEVRLQPVRSAAEVCRYLTALDPAARLRLDNIKPWSLFGLPQTEEECESWWRRLRLNGAFWVETGVEERAGLALLLRPEWCSRMADVFIITPGTAGEEAVVVAALRRLTDYARHSLGLLRLQFAAQACDETLGALLPLAGYVLEAWYDEACLVPGGFCHRFAWGWIEDDEAAWRRWECPRTP